MAGARRRQRYRYKRPWRVYAGKKCFDSSVYPNMAFTQVHYLPPSTYILAMIVRNATSAIDARIIASLKFAFFCSGVMVDYVN